MQTPELLVEKKDHVTTLTLNRPEVRNALSVNLMQDLVTALEEADTDGETRVVILKGAGEKAFCAGADLRMVSEKGAQGIMELRKHFSYYADIIQTLADIGKPVLAAVRGYALAGGCGLAAACDITIASEDAVFGVPEVNIGLWGMIINVPLFRCVVMKKGLELFMTGRSIDAREADRIGLVTKVVPNDRLDEEAAELAQTLASKSPLALKLGKEAFYASQDMEYRRAIQYLREMITILGATEDAKEGISAFLEKRAPRWKGR